LRWSAARHFEITDSMNLKTLSAAMYSKESSFKGGVRAKFLLPSHDLRRD
jgi:hypothetical protein